MRFAEAEKILANEVKQRRVVTTYGGRSLQSTDTTHGLVVFNEQETFVDELLENCSLFALMRGEQSQTQILAPLALQLFLRVFLAVMNPQALEPIGFDSAVVGEDGGQGFDQGAVKVRMLRLAQ